MLADQQLHQTRCQLMSSVSSTAFLSSGLAKEARNSWIRGSPGVCHSGGMVPLSTLSASCDKLENVIASYIMPCPQGDSDAARKASRLYVKRCFSISSLLMIVSQMRSSGAYVLRR